MSETRMFPGVTRSRPVLGPHFIGLGLATWMTGYSKSAIYRSHSSNNYSGGYSLLEQIDDKSPTFRGLPPPSSLFTLSSGGRIDQSLALCLLLLMGILVCVAAKARPASSNPADWRCLFWWLEEGRILDWFPNPKRTQLCYNPRGLDNLETPELLFLMRRF